MAFFLQPSLYPAHNFSEILNSHLKNTGLIVSNSVKPTGLTLALISHSKSLESSYFIPNWWASNTISKQGNKNMLETCVPYHLFTVFLNKQRWLLKISHCVSPLFVSSPNTSWCWYYKGISIHNELLPIFSIYNKNVLNLFLLTLLVPQINSVCVLECIHY